MPLTEAQEAEVADLYRAGGTGASINGLSARFHVGRDPIRAALEKHHVPVRKSRRGPQGSIATSEEIIQAYSELQSVTAVVRRCKSSSERVRRVLKQAGVTIARNRGGRPSKRQQQIERARGVAVEAADSTLTCGYRSPALINGSALLAPECGKPVRLAGAREPLCDEHAVTARDFALTDAEAAVRLRQTVTVRCAKCDRSWSASASRAAASFRAHQKHCPA